MKNLSMTEGKLIGLAGIWGMIGIATLQVLGPELLTGTMAHVAYGVGIMQSVNVLCLKGEDNNDKR